MQRLASEVGWRLFVVGNSVYFMSEEQLYARRPRYELRPDNPSVLDLAYDVDWGKATSEATMTVALERWGAPPGSVVILKDWGAAGRPLAGLLGQPRLVRTDRRGAPGPARQGHPGARQ